MREHLLVIKPDGTVHTLYTDIIDLRELGPLDVQRASNVEWNEKHKGWIVQFADGSYLCTEIDLPVDLVVHVYKPEELFAAHYGTPGARHVICFDSREEALAAEVIYLNARL
jgi:hypothetical protein